jgi:cell wall assembly regulator SMI1
MELFLLTDLKLTLYQGNKHVKIEKMDKKPYNSLETAIESTLAEFEKKIGTRFPEDFRESFIKSNGIELSASTFKISAEQGASRVHEVYKRNLENQWNVFKNRIPYTIIPFASDPFGNQLCIGVTGDEKGKVYFWDHEMEGEEDEQPYYENVYKIAESFQDFLSGLYEG